MELTMLGTGNAMVTECYNTCFVIENHGEYLLVDGGGGNTLLTQLKKANIDWKSIKNIFVTHKHIDHLMGIIWMIRLICQNMSQNSYEGDVYLYAHQELIEIIRSISSMLLQEKQIQFIGQRVHLIALNDGDEYEIIHQKFHFFDIHSTKAKQFGFTMDHQNIRFLTCLGDEPCHPLCYEYVRNSRYLMHEAFCLYKEAEMYKPYEKHHSTVKDACILADQLNIQHLIMYHTEDDNIINRKQLYLEEGSLYYKGKIYIPDDLDRIILK